MRSNFIQFFSLQDLHYFTRSIEAWFEGQIAINLHGTQRVGLVSQLTLTISFNMNDKYIHYERSEY